MLFGSVVMLDRGFYLPTLPQSFQGLVINEFHGNPVIDYDRLPSAYTPNPYQSFITSLGFEQYSKWYSVPILLLNMVFFRVATYAALKYINHERR